VLPEGQVFALLSLLRLRLNQGLRLAGRGTAFGRFKALAVVFFAAGIFFGLFLGSFFLLRFVNSIPGLGPALVERLGYLAAFSFFVLLLFSNTVIGFQLCYRSRETAFFLILPLPVRSLVSFLILESIALATWATVFLALPVGLAYALVFRLSWLGWLGLPLYGFSLAGLAACLGAGCAALIPRRRGPALPLGLIVAALLLLKLLAILPGATLEESGVFSTTMIGNLLQQSRVTLSPLLPSAWAASGFFALARGDLFAAAGQAAVLGVNLAFFGAVALSLLARYFRDNFSRRLSSPGRRRVAPAILGRILSGAFFFLPRPPRALAVKDSLIFLRDPVQWLQSLVLFGLLALYILSIRGFPSEARQPFWQALISTFNLAAASLIMGALGTRFVFPQVSLEGRSIWVLGLAPLRRGTILLTKLALSLAWSLPVMLGLLSLSAHYLRLPPTLTWGSLAAAAALTVSLNLLAVGMGALFPDFQQDNPARIAAGFGGTVSLISAVGLTVAAVIPLGVAFNLQLGGRGSFWPLVPYLVGAGSLLVGSGIFVLGWRHFRRLEF